MVVGAIAAMGVIVVGAVGTMGVMIGWGIWAVRAVGYVGIATLVVSGLVVMMIMLRKSKIGSQSSVTRRVALVRRRAGS